MVVKILPFDFEDKQPCGGTTMTLLSRVFASQHSVLISQEKIMLHVFYKCFWVPAEPQAQCDVLEGEG